MARNSLGRPFWTFWTAATLANLGDGIRLAAFPLLAAALSSDPRAVAGVAAAQFLPWLVTGLYAGVLADRRGARALLAATDAARVVVLVTLAVAVATGGATIALVVAAAFLLGAAETVRDTAAQTAIPRLVPDARLERANGRLVAGEVVGNEFVGPPLGAVLFATGAALPFAVNGASLALAVMLVLSLPLTLARRTPVEPGAPVRAWDGLRWLVRRPVLRTLAFTVAAIAAADSAWFAIFVLYAQQNLGLHALGFGLLLATGAAGGVAGSFAADRLVGAFGHRHVLTWSMASTAGFPVLLVVAPNLVAAVVVVTATSAAFAVLNVAALAVRQRLVPDGLVGRVVAASRTLTYGCSALGALTGGVLAAAAGTGAPFLFSAVIAVAAPLAWAIVSRPVAPGAPA
ncbi:MFS transporter [Actinoplanes xinjiangensis]|uniref:MFS transporter n=1 Tax=Actinoplanes xinjiangensis TaxID=512350 RepID=UPI0034131CFC